MFRRLALTFTLLSLGFTLDVQGATGDAARVKAKATKSATKPALKRVHRKDGSVVVRLDLPVRSSANAGPERHTGFALAEDRSGQVTAGASELAKSYQLMDQWLDAVAEPRFMTALAAAAVEPETKTLQRAIDPAYVRNWAEFVDPDLYLRWKAAGLDPRFNQAIHQRVPEFHKLPQWITHPIYSAIPPEVRAGTPLAPTIWSNAYGGGHGAREAAEEWLKLPSPDPRMNPWLHAGRNYRY